MWLVCGCIWGQAWKGHLGLGLTFRGRCEPHVTHCEGTGEGLLAGVHEERPGAWWGPQVLATQLSF